MPLNTYSGQSCVALYPNESKWVNVNLVPNVALAAGTVLGELSARNDTYTITTGSQGSGNFTVSLGGRTTTNIAFNAASAAVQAAIEALTTVGTGNVTVTNTGTPGTSAVYTVTLVNGLGSKLNTALTATFTGLATPGNASLAQTVIGQPLGVYKAYATGNTDGSQVPKGILQFASATDANGNVSLGAAAIGGPFGQTQKYSSMYIAGCFLCEELTGLDAAAITAGLGRLIEGTVTKGTFRMP